MTQLNKIIKTVLLEQTSKVKGTASKIVGTIMKAMGGLTTDEAAILNALRLITSKDIYNEVLSIVKRQKQTESQRADIIGFNDTNWESLGYTGWKTVLQWIQITDFNPLLSGDSEWLSRYEKILVNFNTKETVGKRKLTGSNIGGVESLAGDAIGGETTAWQDPAFQQSALTTLQIITSFVPIVGWTISAGIGLGKAGMYYQGGDPKQAGIEAIFAVIPGLGLSQKLGLSKIAPKVMANLGKKLALKQTKNLTKQEIRILGILGKNQKALKAELDNYFKTGIAKSAKQLSRDKIAAATKKYGIGLAKTSGTLASYMTIAKLYSDVYDATAPQITDSELLALNNKLDADFEQFLATRYRSKISDGVVQTNNTKLNEASPIEALDFIINNPATSAVYAAAASTVILAFSKRLRSLLIKLPVVKRIPTMYNRLRDRNFLVRNGLKEAGQIKQLYKSGEMLDTYEELWLQTESAVKRGEMTPQEAMKSINFIKTPGTAKLTFKKLTAYYNNAVKTKGMAKSAASAKVTAAAPKEASTEFEKFIMSSDPMLTTFEKATPKVEAAITELQNIPVRKWADWEKANAAQGRLVNAIETLDAKRKLEYKRFKLLTGITTATTAGLWGLMKLWQSSNSKSAAKANWPEFKKWLDIRNIKSAETAPTVTTKKKPVKVPTTTKPPVVRTNIEPTDAAAKVSKTQPAGETEDQFTGFQ